MKIADEKQLADHHKASLRGAIEGTLASGGVAVAASYWAHRRFPAYARLPISLKALACVVVVAPCLSIQAERRGLEYDRTQWEGEGARVLDHKEAEAEDKWEKLTPSQKLGEWAYQRQYSLIMGSWAGSLALAGAIISRQKYQTHAQKIVQARMWAQGLTVGLLIVAGALTQSRRIAAAKEGNNDHSWKDLIDQQERDRQSALRVADGVHAPAH